MEVVAVLTQPDRPSGRGMLLKASPVKQCAKQHGLLVLQPESLKSPEIQHQLAELKADVMVVAAYGLILPKTVLQTPLHGCLNIHASLLPRWRGAAPIQRAILAGDTQTGVTIMQMDEGLDTGNMLLTKFCDISENETTNSLHDKLAILGAEAITEVIDLLKHNKLNPIPQTNIQVTYATKINKEEALIDWNNTAIQVHRAIRSYNPFPGATASINGTLIKIWQASIVEEIAREPGEVIKVDHKSLVVSCGHAALSLEVLQKPNSKAMQISHFLQGFDIKAGDRFKTSKC